MDVSSVIALLMLGFSGTGHCIGMCGPLVIAFPGKTDGMASHLYYHAGRIATYTGVGILMGGVGLAVAKLASVAGYDYLAMIARMQLAFSLLAGFLLLLLGMAQLGIVGEPAWLTIVNPERLPGYGPLVRTALRKTSAGVMFITGVFMGFLPCGLSFAAFSRALAASRPLEGGVFLFAFGLGTLPGLLLIGTGASALSRRYRKHFDIISGMLMIGMAVSLLVKGLATVFAA
jgi:sulfite exporter TauE/SafE